MVHDADIVIRNLPVCPALHGGWELRQFLFVGGVLTRQVGLAGRVRIAFATLPNKSPEAVAEAIERINRLDFFHGKKLRAHAYKPKDEQDNKPRANFHSAPPPTWNGGAWHKESEGQ